MYVYTFFWYDLLDYGSKILCYLLCCEIHTKYLYVYTQLCMFRKLIVGVWSSGMSLRYDSMTASASTWRYGWWIWNHYYLRRFMKVICIWKSLVLYSLYIMIISTGLLDFPSLQFVFWIFMFFLFPGKRERPLHFETTFQTKCLCIGRLHAFGLGPRHARHVSSDRFTQW